MLGAHSLAEEQGTDEEHGRQFGRSGYSRSSGTDRWRRGGVDRHRDQRTADADSCHPRPAGRRRWCERAGGQRRDERQQTHRGAYGDRSEPLEGVQGAESLGQHGDSEPECGRSGEGEKRHPGAGAWPESDRGCDDHEQPSRNLHRRRRASECDAHRDQGEQRVGHVHDAGIRHVAAIDGLHEGDPAQSHRSAAAEPPHGRGAAWAVEPNKADQHDCGDGEPGERDRCRGDAFVGQPPGEERGESVGHRGRDDGDRRGRGARVPGSNGVEEAAAAQLRAGALLGVHPSDALPYGFMCPARCIIRINECCA